MPLRHQVRQHADGAGDGSYGDAERQQNAVLGQHDPAQEPAPKPERPERGELAAALEHVAQENDPQADGAQQEAQPAEGLEGGDVGVLDRLKARDALGRGGDVEAEPVETALQDLGDGSLGEVVARRGLDQEERVAGLAREVFEEVLLRDQQLALEEERVRMEQLTIADWHKLPTLLAEFAEEMDEVGPNPFKDL